MTIKIALILIGLMIIPIIASVYWYIIFNLVNDNYLQLDLQTSIPNLPTILINETLSHDNITSTKFSKLNYQNDSTDSSSIRHKNEFMKLKDIRNKNMNANRNQLRRANNKHVGSQKLTQFYLNHSIYDGEANINDIEYPLDQIIQDRLIKPKECFNDKINHKTQTVIKLQQDGKTSYTPNVEYNDNLNKKFDSINYMPFINRCRVINYFNRDLFHYWHQIYNLNTEIGYLHIWKAGGSTVRNIFADIVNYKREGQKIADSVRRYDYKYLFSYIRDPLSRILSAFYEIHKRQSREIKVITNNNLSVIDNFRYFLQYIYFQMETGNKNKNIKHVGNSMTNPIWLNAHVNPQIIFLTNHQIDNYWSHLPLTFVGLLNDNIINQTIFEIFNELYWKDIDVTKSYKIYVDILNNHKQHKHQRDRHSETYNDRMSSKYNLEIEDLNDEDIELICEIYWMDYICIPFELPKQCNITHLFLKYYNKYVLFDDCYDI